MHKRSTLKCVTYKEGPHVRANGEPRQMHHWILTWAHISDSPRKIRTRGDQVGLADPLGALRRGVPPTTPNHLPYMLLAGTDPEDYKRGLPPPLSHTPFHM